MPAMSMMIGATMRIVRGEYFSSVFTLGFVLRLSFINLRIARAQGP